MTTNDTPIKESEDSKPRNIPREIDPQKTFDALVSWVHDELIVKKGAPGFTIGLSGTDSILTYLICAKAYEKAGHPERVVGIHYGEQLPDSPEEQEKILSENPEELWFQKTIIPWLKEQTPNSPVIVDGSIDYKKDGQRWGALLDWSVIADPETGRMRPRDESYWVVGTRNASEEELMSYSNISNAASIQPIIGLWKSEVLKLCAHLGVPDKAMQKSCQADCVCGRFELPALNIDNVDALLMTRKGTLSPRYVEENITPDLRAQLEQFIDEQINGSSFKKQIPYLPDAESVAMDQQIDREQFALAKQVALTADNDTKAISEATPDIIKNKHANAACDLVCTNSDNRNAWLPEALTLFDTPGLRSSQQRHMLKKVFSCDNLRVPIAKRLSSLNARIGNYGFSFPRMRFTAQGTEDNPSLLEHFGMQRLRRDSDVRDASLPPSNPDRDHLGSGLSWSDGAHTVELRRSYIACSNHSESEPATIIIRNNSYFYGRDRLESPVYVSWEHLSPEELQNIDENTLENSSKFIKWQDMVNATPDMDTKEKINRVERVVNYLDSFEKNFNHWLTSKGPTEHIDNAGPDHSANNDKGGYQHLVDFLKHKTSRPAVGGRPPLYLGDVKNHAAPWVPTVSIPLTKELVGQIEQSPDELSKLLHIDDNESALTLMSGEQGDFPVIGGKASQIGQEKAFGNKDKQL